jgi:hypothetical protein
MKYSFAWAHQTKMEMPQMAMKSPAVSTDLARYFTHLHPEKLASIYVSVLA